MSLAPVHLSTASAQIQLWLGLIVAAHSIAIVIFLARRLRRWRGRADIQACELTLLNRMMAATSSAQGPDELLAMACRELATTFDLPYAVSVLLGGADQSCAEIVSIYPPDQGSDLRGIEIATEGIPAFSWVTTNQTPLVITDVSNDPQTPRGASTAKPGHPRR